MTVRLAVTRYAFKISDTRHRPYRHSRGQIIMPILLSRHTGTHRIPTAPTPEARTPTPLIDTALIDIVGEPVV